jgi:hypothetical protein
VSAKLREILLQLDQKRKLILYQIIEDHLLFSKSSALFNKLVNSIFEKPEDPIANKQQSAPAPAPAGDLVMDALLENFKVSIIPSEEVTKNSYEVILFQISTITAAVNQTAKNNNKLDVNASIAELLVRTS